MSAGKNNQLKLNVTVGRSSSTPLFRGTFYALYSPDNFNVANYTNNHKRNVIAFICELPVKHRLTARRSHIKYMTTPTIYIRCSKTGLSAVVAVWHSQESPWLLACVREFASVRIPTFFVFISIKKCFKNWWLAIKKAIVSSLTIATNHLN